jgi:hypothetical protein
MTPKRIIIHCANTPNGSTIYTAKDIDAWHMARGFRRNGPRGMTLPHVGYHWIIEVSGACIEGRRIDEEGAHCIGHNGDSIGICMLGRDQFTSAQWMSLLSLVRRTSVAFGGLPSNGHREFDPHKTCPGFDVLDWLRRAMVPRPEHDYDGESSDAD